MTLFRLHNYLTEIMARTNWEPHEDAYLLEHYISWTSAKIGKFLNRSIKSVQMRAFHIGKKAVDRSGIKIIWTEEMNTFLRENYLSLSNKQLAKKLNLNVTVCRNQLRFLNLRRDAKEWYFWTTEEVNFLLENYKIMGDVEISEKLNEIFQRVEVKAHRKTISKKRFLLKLHRTQEEIEAIVKRNKKQKRFDLSQAHSSIKDLSDNYILGFLCKNQKDLKPKIEQNKELIQLQRTIYQAQRLCKQK